MKRSKIAITDNGKVIVPSDVRMNISEIADLFGIFHQTVKRHIRAIEKQCSTERSVVKLGIATGDDTLGCSVEGMNIYPDYYGLEMIITIAFRV